VVVVIFTIASVGPHFGIGTSSMWMSRTSLNTAARIVSGMSPPLSSEPVIVDDPKPRRERQAGFRAGRDTG